MYLSDLYIFALLISPPFGQLMLPDYTHTWVWIGDITTHNSPKEQCSYHSYNHLGGRLTGSLPVPHNVKPVSA